VKLLRILERASGVLCLGQESGHQAQPLPAPEAIFFNNITFTVAHLWSYLGEAFVGIVRRCLAQVKSPDCRWSVWNILTAPRHYEEQSGEDCG
jgi:hypothetical protein